MFYAGFDVGGTNARLEVFDQSYQTVFSERRPVRDVLTPKAMAKRLAEMLIDSGIDGNRLKSIGLGLAGQMSADGQMVFNSPNLGWRNIAFGALLTEELRGFSSAKVAVANDLNALLWGEFMHGAAKGTTDALAVFVGTGVGGAIIANGGLVHGAGGKAGEIGHMKVAFGGRLCGCGEFGCLEAYAGGIHLERRLVELSRDLEAVKGMDLAAADAAIFEVSELRAVWEEVTTFLGATIANAVTMLNPEVVVLGGGVLENLPNVRDMTLRTTTPLILSACRDDVRFEMSVLKDRAGVLGAAMLANLA
jgi:glucokinase